MLVFAKYVFNFLMFCNITLELNYYHYINVGHLVLNLRT